MSPSSQHPPTSLTPSSCVNEHLLGMLLWTFSFSSAVICVQKHIRTKYMYYSLVCWQPPRFTLFTLLAPGMWIYSRWFPVTTDDAHCSDLTWVNTRVLLISCSTHSSKLSPWLSSLHIDCEEQRKECMHKTNRIFEQTPSPHIYHTHAYVHMQTHIHTHSHCSSLSSPTCTPSLLPTLWPLFLPTHTPSLTSEHVLSSLSLHHVCTATWHSVREEGEGRWEEGKQRKEEGGIKIRKKRERRKKEGRGWEEEKGRGEEWRMEWLTSACKAIFPWKDGFSAPITFGTTKTNFMPLKLMA